MLLQQTMHSNSTFVVATCDLSIVDDLLRNQLCIDE